MIIRKVNAGDAPVDLDREVELMMASEFGYLMNDTDRSLTMKVKKMIGVTRRNTKGE